MKWKGCSGSVTVEAAISFPLFLMVLLSMLMFINICRTYNTMQFALQDTARKIAGMAYFYHITGMNDLSVTLSNQAEQAMPILDEQMSKVIEFTNAFGGCIGADQNGTVKVDQILQQLQGVTENWKNLKPVLEEIMNDPQKQARILAAVFGHEMGTAVRNKLLRQLAQMMLLQSLTDYKQVDIATRCQQMGIVDGMFGVNLSASQTFSDGQTLELVVQYRMKGLDLFGILEQIPMCNRVRIIGWTGGVGNPQRSAFEGNIEQKSQSSESMWNQYDDNKQYKMRGSSVEILELAGLQSDSNRSILAEQNNHQYSAYADYVTLNTENMEATAYQFFTLNSFMKTYQDNHAALGRRMAENADKLLKFDLGMADERIGYGQARTLKRVLILIVPENAEPWVQEEFQRMAAQLYEAGIDQIELVGAYGDYIAPVQEGV